MKQVVIGFLGCGNIGSGVWNNLKDMAPALEQRYGLQLTVARILVKSVFEPIRADVPKGLLTENVEDILQDPRIDIVCEFMGGEQPAAEYMRRALEAGKDVVTANKKALSTHWKELQKTASSHNRRLMFEASVGGATPMIAVLRESLCCNAVLSLYGIINGTTNQILSDMEEKGCSYRDALNNAQRLGLAEPDPSDDVQGFDAAYKLSILCAISFYRAVEPGVILRRGIEKIIAQDIEAASKLGYKVRLVAKAVIREMGVALAVQPMFISVDHPLALVSGAYNGLFIRGNACGEMFLKGLGAGSAPTGAAVSSDIVKCALGCSLPCAPILEDAVIQEDTEALRRVIRISADMESALLKEPALHSASCLRIGHWSYIQTTPMTPKEESELTARFAFPLQCFSILL